MVDRAEDDAAADLMQRDLTEAREHLAATSEVLAVLGRSGSDLEAILGAVVDSARQLCRCDAALMYLLDGDASASPGRRGFLRRCPPTSLPTRSC